MMSDTEVAAQIARTDAFIPEFRELVAATAIDPASPCADAQRAAFGDNLIAGSLHFRSRQNPRWSAPAR